MDECPMAFSDLSRRELLQRRAQVLQALVQTPVQGRHRRLDEFRNLDNRQALVVAQRD